MPEVETNPPQRQPLATQRLQLPGYELREQLGAGGYGKVYLATQRATGAQVAIKVVHLDEDERRLARFHRETELCSRLHHPHIVQLLDRGRQGDCVYGVFEYIPGETLKRYLLRKGVLSALEAGHIMTQVLDALDCAHQAGIVHRDLKPDNIMITSTGMLTHAMVLDFGISTLVPAARDAQFAALTKTEEFLGTPLYCAPEQLRGELPGVKADLYAWGLMFLECLTGVAAMSGSSTAEILHQQLSPQEVPLPPEVSAHPLGTVLRRALRKGVVERCGSARSLLVDLRQVPLETLVGALRSTQAPAPDAPLRTLATKRGFAEKRQVTLLCCSVTVWPAVEVDADGPAELEALELAQREEFSAFADAAVQRGGMLAGTLGDRMLIVFGYPHTCDSDVRRAGATALQLQFLSQQRGAALRAAQPLELSVRIGLHAGSCVMTPGDVPMGHVVNFAARLESLAAPGTILVSTDASRSLRAFAELECEEHVAPAVLGVDQQCYRLLSQRHQGRTAARAHACIGRDAELEALLRTWAGTRQGQGSLTLISGEAGIGKSCIVGQLREHVAGEGGTVAHAQCMPEHVNSALAPILTLLRRSLGGGDGNALREQLAASLHAAGCDIQQVLPIFCAWLSLPFGPHAASQVSPALQRELLLDALVLWLQHSSRPQSLLLVIEDLHWVDPTTVALLERLVVSLEQQPLMVVLTARPSWLAPPAFGAAAIRPERLDRTHAAAVARQALAPKSIDPRVIEYVVARTDGVPLFVQELARMLAEAHLVEREGHWTFRDEAGPAQIPTTLRDSLISRFDRLGGAREVLQLAATLGRCFDVALLQACVDPESVSESLQVLQAAGLIALAEGQPGAMAFRHALIRDTAYDCMLNEQRRLKHRSVVRALSRQQPERIATTPSLIAAHHAGAGDPARAVECGIAQLHLSQLRSLNDETIAYAQQVESWVKQLDAQQQREAQLDLNGYVTQALMNKHGWANTQVIERLEVANVLLGGTVRYELEVRQLWSMITFHHVSSNRAEVRRLSERLLLLAQREGDAGVLVAASTYLGLAHYSEGDFIQAEHCLSRAIEDYQPAHAGHAGELGFDTRVWATCGRALVRWFAGHGAASTDAAQAVQWGREIDHVPSLCMALLYQALGYQARGEREAALDTTTELLALTSRYGLPAFAGYGRIIACWARSEVSEADRWIETLWAMGCRYCQTYYRAFAAETLALQGHWDQALARIEHSLQLTQQLHEHMYTAELHLARARYLRGAGADAATVDVCLQLAIEVARGAGKSRTLVAAQCEMQR
jgi:TOMM system kinase/cyclase fusion protein